MPPDPAIVARLVAQDWLDAIMASDTLRSTGMSHPVAMVLAALDGETDPLQLGINKVRWPAFLAALAAAAPPAEPEGLTGVELEPSDYPERQFLTPSVPPADAGEGLADAAAGSGLRETADWSD